MTDSHIKCIVSICVSFLYSCLTFETLHYLWIPSYNEFPCHWQFFAFVIVYIENQLDT